MRTIFSLTFMIFAFLSPEGKAQSLDLKTTGAINVYDNNGQINEELNSQRPSCSVVKHRLQEYFKRANEAEDFLDWYKPEEMSIKQSRALLNLLLRTPFFTNDRLYKNVRVFFQWEIPREEFEQLSKFPVLPKKIVREKEIWSDPFNGRMPDEYTFEIYDRQHVIAQMSMMMSYESYCLETTETALIINTPSLTVNFTGTHDPEEL